jgi:serine protease
MVAYKDERPDYEETEEGPYSLRVRPPDEGPDYSGFVIVRLAKGAAGGDAADLRRLAHEEKLGGLETLLDQNDQIETSRVVRSLPPEELLSLEREAFASEFPPLNSLTAYWRLDCRTSLPEIERLVKELNGLPEVELAYREMAVSDPAVNPADDTFNGTQNYLDAAPTGIDARWAWTQPNGVGAGVGLVDLEQGWFPGHEDLTAKTPTLIFNDNRDGIGGYKGNHGTAVLGEIVGVDNALGVVGIAPAVTSVQMVSHYESGTNTALHVADAIVAAIAAMPAGDVLLLEVQRNLLPTETDAADFDAIRLAVAHGIIVVEAGGNGGMDLDAWTFMGATVLNRTSAAFRDSGAIMVGAALSPLPHDRAGFSNFGTRIDCYGWGENVTSAGYGDLTPSGTPDNSTYTAVFSGTSSASPIITGAALIVQGSYEAASGTRLSPTQMRTLLSNPATGTPQGGNVAGNIGVMPNLQSIIQTTLGLVPDIYLRDAVGDMGVIPSAGAISVSPDVIVTTAVVADPTASFGEGSGTENVDTLGSQVEAGQDNFIYVRMRNRGNGGANGTTATVYWSEVATLVTPGMWHFIGSSAPVNVPQGNTLVVTDPITWSAGDIPATGHYCFVATVSHLQDLEPPLPGPTDWAGFQAYIRNNNNVTWRNFNVVDVLPDPSADPVEAKFMIVGAPDRARIFDLEITQQLPKGMRIWLELPLALYAPFRRAGIVEAKFDKKAQRVRVLLPSVRSLSIRNLRLGPSEQHRSKFLFPGAKELEQGLHTVAIRQLYRREEVGRVTWGLRASRKGGERTEKRPQRKK